MGTFRRGCIITVCVCVSFFFLGVPVFIKWDNLLTCYSSFLNFARLAQLRESCLKWALHYLKTRSRLFVTRQFWALFTCIPEG